MPRRAPQIVNAEPPFQIVSGRRLTVARPEPLQVVRHAFPRWLSRFLPLMQAQDQPFEVRLEENEVDFRPRGDRLRVASVPPVFRKPVGVQENKAASIWPFLPYFLGAASYDARAVSSTGDEDVQMKMSTLVIAEALQPSCKRAFAFSLGPDEDAPSPRYPRTGHRGSVNRKWGSRPARRYGRASGGSRRGARRRLAGRRMRGWRHPGPSRR